MWRWEQLYRGEEGQGEVWFTQEKRNCKIIKHCKIGIGEGIAINRRGSEGAIFRVFNSMRQLYGGLWSNCIHEPREA